MKRIQHILLVDDEPGIGTAVAAALERDGYRCSRAADGNEGLETARRDRPDLVITDLRMDGCSGLDLMKGLDEIHPGTPVIVMTGFGTVDEFIPALRLGAVDFILKPFRMQEIRDGIARAECSMNGSRTEASTPVDDEAWEKIRTAIGSAVSDLGAVDAIEVRAGDRVVTLVPPTPEESRDDPELPELHRCLWS